ncbi:MAG: hypothetical protein FWF08_09780 [Oscillospiraceae bacterium]|nr:hypothetical protein [Oscillospiraceae bacterium]
MDFNYMLNMIIDRLFIRVTQIANAVGGIFGFTIEPYDENGKYWWQDQFNLK